ncbi:MAG: hypothetical protein GXP53_07740 [Deltaproteobacteria bacterium]|nr:hypothetical protein [Deltaproteobacteria bacterium]
MVILLFFVLIFMPDAAIATQGHRGIEGLYVHLIAHVFFIFSMVLFVYWIQKGRLIEAAGWKYIRYSAYFFILWNIDCIVVHLLESHLYKIAGASLGILILPVSNAAWINGIYYFMKMDHFFCVPAMAFLFLGLKRLLEEELS